MNRTRICQFNQPGFRFVFHFFLVGLALSLSSLSVQGDHETGCYKEHDGIHVFPATSATITIETVDDPELGPFADQTDTVELIGPTTVLAVTSEDGDSMDTEIIEMHLTGVSTVFGEVTISESATKASLGSVTKDGANCFPATSTFEVFVDVISPMPLHNNDPFVMEASLAALPPHDGGTPDDPDDDDNYVSVSDVVALFNSGDALRALASEADHKPYGGGGGSDSVEVRRPPPPPEGGGGGGGGEAGGSVPTLSQWGILAMAAVLLSVGALRVLHRPGK